MLKLFRIPWEILFIVLIVAVILGGCWFIQYRMYQTEASGIVESRVLATSGDDKIEIKSLSYQGYGYKLLVIPTESREPITIKGPFGAVNAPSFEPFAKQGLYRMEGQHVIIVAVPLGLDYEIYLGDEVLARILDGLKDESYPAGACDVVKYHFRHNLVSLDTELQQTILSAIGC